MKTFINALKNWVAPNLCFGCNVQTEAPLCSCCLQKLDRPSSEALPNVFQNYPLPKVSRVYALWNFDKGGIIQKIQHGLKYKNLPVVGKQLGAWLGLGCLSQYKHKLPDYVLPIPLSPLRFIERGYNQAECLVDGIKSVEAMVQFAPLMERKTHTETQTKLNQQGRWENMKSVFTINQPDKIIGKHILLVDDVLTTGATLAAAAMCLYEAGAAQVDFAVLAYVH